MCQSISWSKRGRKLYYLTTDDLGTDKGKELTAYTNNAMDDVRGHGALRRFHFGDEAMKGLEDHEMTDFTSPKNFPKEIARAFLTGAFFHEYLFDLNMLSCLDEDVVAVAELAKKRTELGRLVKALAAYDKACATQLITLIQNPANLNEAWKKLAEEGKR